MATMNDILNQLVGLCAGRRGLLRLERRQLLEEFKRLPDSYEHKDEYLSDCQLCMNVVEASAEAGKEFERRSFLKPWEQPNHGIIFRHRRQLPELETCIQLHGSVNVLNSFALLQTQPLNPTGTPAQQAPQSQGFTIPPTWSGEHKTSFPRIVLPMPLILSRSHPCKSGQDHQERTKKATNASSSEHSKPALRGNIFQAAVMNSNCLDIETTASPPDRKITARRRDSKSVCFDKFQAKMHTLSMKIIRQSRIRREIILRCPENRHRVRVEVDAEGSSPEEMKQARQSTTFRGDYGLRYQLPNAGKVDVYKNAHAMKGRPGRCYRGWKG